MNIQIPETSGIYKIRNILNDKIYVGSAVNLKKRWFHHRKLLRADTHFNIHLQRAWGIDGEENFCFEVIELCQKNQLLSKEQYHIDCSGCADDAIGYNLNPVAGSQLGRKWSDESRKKISDSLKGRIFTDSHKMALSEAWHKSQKSKEQNKKAVVALIASNKSRAGRIESEETRKKKSLAKIGKPLSPEHRAKISHLNRTRDYSYRKGGIRGPDNA